MSWFVYMIECDNGSLYTGIALDPQARFALHAAGKGARYTRANRPVRLLMMMPFVDRSSASRMEYQLKRLPASEKRDFAARHAPGPASGTPPTAK